MKLRTTGRSFLAAATLMLLLQAPTHSSAQQPSSAPLAASTVPVAQLMQPQELAKLLTASVMQQPLILQVGSRVMFDQAHIPNSEYVGPGSRDEGLAALRDRVRALPKSTFIVLYCGCCPWTRCPNVGNAYQTLHDLGFTNVKVLYLADNFGTNWVTAGFPVAH